MAVVLGWARVGDTHMGGSTLDAIRRWWQNGRTEATAPPCPSCGLTLGGKIKVVDSRAFGLWVTDYSCDKCGFRKRTTT